jgi:hypothetical protein
MKRRYLYSFAIVFAVSQATIARSDDQLESTVKPFLKNHCVKCHGPTKQAGDFRVDRLGSDPTADKQSWLLIGEQLRDGLMPPAKEAKPDQAKQKEVVTWIAAHAATGAARLPNQGNLIPHELLFGKPATEEGATDARVWRLSPEGYMGFVRDVARGRTNGLVQPFTLIPERGIRDFAELYTIDEPSAEILLRNAEAIVESQTGHTLKDGVVQGKGDTVREFVRLMNPADKLDPAQIESAIDTQFRLAIGRGATADETKRFAALYEKCRAAGDQPGAVKTMLQAVLLKTDALYRSEMGRPGETTGRLMLEPIELSRALSLALGDRRDGALHLAAQKGELNSKEKIAGHLRRMLADPKVDKSRIPGFFRAYFEYHKAVDVFKDKPKTFVHTPSALVSDTDRLVLYLLKQDKDVFRQMLTTPLSFVNYSTKQNKTTRLDEPAPLVTLNPNNDKGKSGVESVYGVEAWPNPQPSEMPKESRLGILMQPSWLAAFSTNFENDPVRRGRWIRERLLGGTVPDLPIGVVAQVPDEPHRAFRERLRVTREAQCWKCHQRMDDLGLPFENFDHYGRFQKAETVHDLEATEKNVDKKGRSLGLVTREIPLNTAGLIADSGDPKLDGPVADPRHMMRKLADSDRVRQVFIRHVFRYFLGRNETLSDARTLQEADRAYQESGGSFNALVISLLTSDSFLCRRPAAPAQAQRSSGDRQ